MNNYYNYPNYNYQNKVQNQMNYNNPKLYNPYEGFIRGNLFPNLYDGYKDYKPFQINPMNEQAEMLTNIDSLGFATIDLDLYLDINPNDQNAIGLFNQYRKEKEELIKNYELKYGPLLLNSEALNSVPWMWNDRPWHWEN